MFADEPSIRIGIRINGRFYGIDWSVKLWRTFEAYDAEEQDGRVFVREQRHKVTRRKRRIVTRPTNHPKRDSHNE